MMDRKQIEEAAQDWFKEVPCPEPDEIAYFVVQQVNAAREEDCTELSIQRTQDDLGFPLQPEAVLAEAIRRIRALKIK